MTAQPMARTGSVPPQRRDPDGPAISVRGLTRVYEVPGRRDARVVALDGVSADLPAGSFTAVVGASGSGKSMLLHTMAGLDEPTGALDLSAGQVVLTWLRRLAARGATVVMVTHDVEAAARADAVAVMSGGRLVTWSETRDAAHIAELVHSARMPARTPGHVPANQAPAPALSAC